MDYMEALWGTIEWYNAYVLAVWVICFLGLLFISRFARWKFWVNQLQVVRGTSVVEGYTLLGENAEMPHGKIDWSKFQLLPAYDGILLAKNVSMLLLVVCVTFLRMKRTCPDPNSCNKLYSEVMNTV